MEVIVVAMTVSPTALRSRRKGCLTLHKGWRARDARQQHPHAAVRPEIGALHSSGGLGARLFESKYQEDFDI